MLLHILLEKGIETESGRKRKEESSAVISKIKGWREREGGVGVREQRKRGCNGDRRRENG